MEHASIAYLGAIAMIIVIIGGISGIRRNKTKADKSEEILLSEVDDHSMSLIEEIPNPLLNKQYSLDEVAYIFGKDPKEKTVDKLIDIFKGPSDPTVKMSAYRRWKRTDTNSFYPSRLIENLPGFTRLEGESIPDEYAIGFTILETPECDGGLWSDITSSYDFYSAGAFTKHYRIVYFVGATGLSDGDLVGSMVYAIKTDVYLNSSSILMNNGRYPGANNRDELSWCRNEIHDLFLAFNQNIDGAHVVAYVREQDNLAQCRQLESTGIINSRISAKRIRVKRAKALLNNSRGFPIARHLL